MEKNIILLRKDFMTNLEDLVNNSGLPAFVMLDVLKDASSQLVPIVEKQEVEAIRQFRIDELREKQAERRNEDSGDDKDE